MSSRRLWYLHRVSVIHASGGPSSVKLFRAIRPAAALRFAKQLHRLGDLLLQDRVHLTHSPDGGKRRTTLYSGGRVACVASRVNERRHLDGLVSGACY